MVGKTCHLKLKKRVFICKYTEIWNKIKSILNVKFHSQLVDDDKYIKTKVKIFNNKETICIDSVQY